MAKATGSAEKKAETPMDKLTAKSTNDKVKEVISKTEELLIAGGESKGEASIKARLMASAKTGRSCKNM